SSDVCSSDLPTTGVQHPESAGRAHREVVRDGERPEVDGVAGDAADLVAGPERVDVVVVGAGDQLGNPGASAGQLQESDVARLRAVQFDGFFVYVGQCE